MDLMKPLSRKARPPAEEQAARAYKDLSKLMEEVKLELEHICAGVYGGQDEREQYVPGVLQRLAKMEEEVESIKEANRREDQNQEWIMGRLARVLGEETPSKRGGEASGPTIPVR